MTRRPIGARLRTLFELAIRRPERAAEDGEAELRSVVAEHEAHLTARGHSPEQAHAEAARLWGESSRDSVRLSAERREHRIRRVEWIAELRHDLRLAGRTLWRAPATSLAAILTLALAIGANTAIFSAVTAVLLRPLPYDHPERLVMLWEKNPDFGWERADAAPANLLDWREQTDGFADVAGYAAYNDRVTLTGVGEPRMLGTQSVTGNFFDLVGVRAHLGRVFRDAETWQDGGPPVAMVSFQTWRDVFGSDPAVVGRSVQLNGRTIEIVGVLPERFTLPGNDAEIWRPMRWDRADRAQVWFRRAHWVHGVARLKPDVSLERADASLQTVVSRLERDFPATNTRMGAGLTPLHEFLVGNTKLPLLVMFGSVGALLLIACANVANLLLAKAAGSAREAAVRLALGAGRGRVLRQALAESGLLAGLGGIAGVALGWWGTRALVALQPVGLLPIGGVAVNQTVLLYALGATTLAAAVFGIVPTVWIGRQVPADVLRDQSRGATGTRRVRRWGDSLLVAQVAIAIALTLGAGLLGRSYLRLVQVEPGFDPRRVLTVALDLPGARFDSVRKVLAFYAELEQQVRALPGVESAAVVGSLPLGPPSWSSDFAIAGLPPRERGSQVVHREMSADYHRTMRVPLLKGRLLTEADRRGAPMVVLVNETLARIHFPDRDPIGQRVVFDRVPDSSSNWRTIVGVVGDERQEGLGIPVKPEFQAPYEQEPGPAMTLIVRTSGEPLAHASPIRALIARLDPLLAVGAVETMEEVRSRSLGRDRFLTVLLLSFAGVGLCLTLVGTYGVISNLTRRRIREMGIRVALGAGARQVQWLVVRHGLATTVVGIAVGVAVALLTTGLLRNLLYQVAPSDPLTFVAVPGLVLVTAAVASWLPAVRASRTDPTQVLRAE
jgi:putative ABC transport system permease protein